MITELEAHNFGCLRDVSLKLTRMHALIGPNDSGKSTILRGLRTLGQFASSIFWRPNVTWEPFDPDLPEAVGDGSTVLLAQTPAGSYAIESDKDGFWESAVGPGGTEVRSARAWNVPSQLRKDSSFAPLLAELRGARLVRFDPDALKRSSGLVPESEAVTFADERGEGLPGVYQAIQGRGDDSFASIRDQVRELFPTVRNLRVTAITRDQLVLEAELLDGTRVRADRMSEGLLYFLAFAALPHLEPASLLLVEEPENGLHPARIEHVVQMMREAAHRMNTQIVIATHSPLVINCMQPDEVTVVTRPSLESGTRVTRIQETPNFDKRRSVYELGELWLSYADGNVEAPLMQATSDEAAAGG